MEIHNRGPLETDREFRLVESSESVLEEQVWPELSRVLEAKRTELGNDIVDKLIKEYIAKILLLPGYSELRKPRIVCRIFNEDIMDVGNTTFDYPRGEVQRYIENGLIEKAEVRSIDKN
jgi:hypothetical protein